MSRLLVSVRDVDEAQAALDGGADIVDIKEPDSGSLGKADDAVIADILKRVADRAPVSAALGELIENPGLSSVFSSLRWLKVGLSHQRDRDWQSSLTAVFASHRQQAVAVAYADAQRAQAPQVEDVLAWAVEQRTAVFLIDTFIKDGSTLLDHVSETALLQWIKTAQSHDIPIALAGSLRGEVFNRVIALKPDIIAVRGAACVGNDRRTHVDTQKIVRLHQLIQAQG